MRVGPNPSELVLLAIVTGVRGLRGDLRIKSFTAESKDLSSYGLLWDKAGRTSYQLRIVGESKGQLIAQINDIRDRTEAEKLKGLELYVPRDAFPQLDEEEFYYSDLIGLKAVSLSGESLGKVSGVENYGAGDIIEITGGAYKYLGVPFSIEICPEINLEDGVLYIDPPEGLLESSIGHEIIEEKNP